MAMTIYLFAAMAALAKWGKPMAVERVPESDEHRPPETVRAELEGEVTRP